MVKAEAVRFIIAGTFNTLFCYLIFSTALFVGLERTLAMTIATLITIPVSLFIMSRHVFACDLSIKRSVSFFIMQGVGYFFNISILLLVSWAGISDYFSGIISLSITAFLTFLISKYLIFYKSITRK